jgi:hypothetical protein
VAPSRKRILWYIILFFIVCAAAFAFFKIKRLFRKGNDQIVFSEIKRKDYSSIIFLHSEFYNLENEDPSKNAAISTEKSFSGSKSTHLSTTTEYGYTISKKLNEIPSYEKLKSLQIELKCWMGPEVDANKAQYILSIDDSSGKNVLWASKPLVTSGKNEWVTVQMTFRIKPDAVNSENTLKLYPWNPEKKDFYIDDIKITYNGAKSVSSAIQEKPETNFLFDFETAEGLYKTSNIKEGVAHSGNFACDLSDRTEYSAAVIKQLGEVGSEPIKEISAGVWIYSKAENATVVLEVSIVNSKEESLFWEGKTIEGQFLPKNKWTKVNMSVRLPVGELSLDDFIIVDVWNKGKTAIIIDDLEIIYGGENDRRGEDSQIDPNTIYQKQYVAIRNKPPFPPLYFQKADLKNNNSVFLANNKTGDLAPGDEFIVGNFCSGPTKQDMLLHIKNENASIYAYCSETGRFVQQWNIQKSARNSLLFDPATEKITGDFDKNGTKEILLVNKKIGAGQLISFTGSCDCKENKLTQTDLWKDTGTLFEPWKTNAADIILSGDFAGEEESELLLINSHTGRWSVLQFNGRDWKTVASDKENTLLDPMLFDKKNSLRIVGKFYANLTKDVLLISVINPKTERVAYYSLEYNSGQKKFNIKTEVEELSSLLFFKNPDNLLKGNFNEDGEEEILVHSNDWRFDLKLLEADPQGFTITNQVDFKGYPKDYNPKYYEFVKIVSGNFVESGKTSLLVMMRNCSDKNFNGTECTGYEDVDYLPNSTQLYFIQN